ncbi:MAG: succinate dehydrogenase assembly factor 2 [Pseudomonadota bacterium]
MSGLTDPRRKQLLYRAQHRGFKEADLLIGGFAEEALAGMSDADLDEFQALLMLDDRDLFDWATGKRDAPANVSGPVFQRLCAFDVSKITAP